MMKIIQLTFILSLLVTMTSCPAEEINEDLTIINNSEQRLFVTIGMPNTNGICSPKSLPLKKEGPIIEKNKTVMIGISYYISPCDSLKIFVLSADTVDIYPWEKIRENNMILKRYDLTLQQLNKMNWTITYP